MLCVCVWAKAHIVLLWLVLWICKHSLTIISHSIRLGFCLFPSWTNTSLHWCKWTKKSLNVRWFFRMFLFFIAFTLISKSDGVRLAKKKLNSLRFRFVTIWNKIEFRKQASKRLYFDPLPKHRKNLFNQNRTVLIKHRSKIHVSRESMLNNSPMNYT